MGRVTSLPASSVKRPEDANPQQNTRWVASWSPEACRISSRKDIAGPIGTIRELCLLA
jgi:hypothetical protein